MDPFSKTSRALALTLLLASGPLLAACEEEGPAEQLGEAVDEAAKDAGRAIEDAAN